MACARRSTTQSTSMTSSTTTARRRARRPAEALAHQVARFRALPSLTAYRALHDEAAPIGEWRARRERALAHLRAALERPELAARAWAWTGRDRSVLVDILLWEDDLDRAWEEAHAGGCSPELWRRLGRERAAERPADAIAVYRMLVGRAVSATNDNAYGEAVELLRELRELLGVAGEEDHARLVAEVRGVHRRKRNLMRLLDAEGWTATGAR
jgi:hypothetical protein